MCKALGFSVYLKRSAKGLVVGRAFVGRKGARGGGVVRAGFQGGESFSQLFDCGAEGEHDFVLFFDVSLEEGELDLEVFDGWVAHGRCSLAN